MNCWLWPLFGITNVGGSNELFSHCVKNELSLDKHHLVNYPNISTSLKQGFHTGRLTTASSTHERRLATLSRNKKSVMDEAEEAVFTGNNLNLI
jgi:hypothetical protein